MILPLALAVGWAGGAAERTNFALNRPAIASSIENDEHSAARANDGDSRTSWRADDEPEGGPEWWQVDLGKPVDLSGCQIAWPYDGKNYRYRIEGSADRMSWRVLSDQSNTASRSQVQNLKFKDAAGIRYVRVTITGFDDGCWASISEVKLFGRP
ncbi:MAG TPA: discoidin domain-containing protein [Tepidisphaeraceae bacterium]